MKSVGSRYYSAIDGLRALAVLSVVIFHLRTGYLAGGYIGVDIFFVISGFVVSMSIVEIEKTTFLKFAATFYARRILRIAPALIFCLIITTVFSCLFIPHAWLSDVNWQTGLAAFFGLSNLILLKTANDYFAPRAEFNPFTHTWSLAIEEQFYLVVPLIIYWFSQRRFGVERKNRSIYIVLVLSLFSICASAWWTFSRPTWAFYLLPARFWELGAGVALFMSMPKWSPIIASWTWGRAKLMGYGLLACLLLSLFIASEKAFPFPWAIAPVGCTAGILALIVTRNDEALPKLLSRSPAVQIGKISYSLYLWHWPTFVLFRWTCGMDSFVEKICALVLSFALAFLSYRFIETPFRRIKFFVARPPGRIVVMGLFSIFFSSALAALLFFNERNISLSVTADSKVWSPAAKEKILVKTECQVESIKGSLVGGTVQAYTARNCRNDGSMRRLYVAGDSHASAYEVMLQNYASMAERDVIIITKGGCPLFDMTYPMTSGPPDCASFTKAVLTKLETELKKGDQLFLPSLRVPRFSDQWGGRNSILSTDGKAKNLARQLAVVEAREYLSLLSRKGVQIIFEAPKPLFRAPPFRCSDWFNELNPVCADGLRISRKEIEDVRANSLASIKAVASTLESATIWDPLPVLCPGAVCNAYLDGKPLFLDGDHLSGFGNMLLLPSFFSALKNSDVEKTKIQKS